MSLLRTRGRIRALGLLFPLVLGLFLGGCGARLGVSAPSTASSERTVTVIGRGQISEPPDIARTTLGVDVVAPTAVAALRDAATRMAAVLDAVKKLGVVDRDLQTSALALRSERVAPAGTTGDAPASIVYHVSNSISVTVRDTPRTGALVDAAVSAGANGVWGVSFTHRDEAELRARARDLAVADAHARAEGLARASGAALGAVISIEEVGVAPYGRAMGAGDVGYRAAEATPIQAGELTVVDQIQIVYALEPEA